MLHVIQRDRARERFRDALRRGLALLGLGGALLLATAGIARADFSLDWYTIDGGGHTFSSGGPFTLGGTVGQPDAGTAAGGSYVLRGGFWLGGEALSNVGDPDVSPGIGPGDDPVHGANIPTTFRVMLGRSNPFQHQTEIRLELPESRTCAVRVFDHSGRLVRRLHDGRLGAGYHRLTWDGTDGGGRPMPNGPYLLQVRAGDAVSRQQVVLLK